MGFFLLQKLLESYFNSNKNKRERLLQQSIPVSFTLTIK